MRFEQMTSRPGTWLAFLCQRCGRRIELHRELVRVDRDGPAFQAYYHDACAAEAQREADLAKAAATGGPGGTCP